MHSTANGLLLHIMCKIYDDIMSAVAAQGQHNFFRKSEGLFVSTGAQNCQ